MISRHDLARMRPAAAKNAASSRELPAVRRFCVRSKPFAAGADAGGGDSGVSAGVGDGSGNDGAAGEKAALGRTRTPAAMLPVESFALSSAATSGSSICAAAGTGESTTVVCGETGPVVGGVVTGEDRKDRGDDVGDRVEDRGDDVGDRVEDRGDRVEDRRTGARTGRGSG